MIDAFADHSPLPRILAAKTGDLRHAVCRELLPQQAFVKFQLWRPSEAGIPAIPSRASFHLIFLLISAFGQLLQPFDQVSAPFLFPILLLLYLWPSMKALFPIDTQILPAVSLFPCTAVYLTDFHQALKLPRGSQHLNMLFLDLRIVILVIY